MERRSSRKSYRKSTTHTSISWFPGSANHGIAQLVLLLLVYGGGGQVRADAQVMPSEIRQSLLLGDTATAVAWLKSSVAEGDSNAAYELGKLYRLGRGVPKSREKALDLFKLAAAANHEEAEVILSRLKPAGDAANSKQETQVGSTETPGAADWFASVDSGSAPPSSGSSQNYEVQNEVGTPLLVHAVERQQDAWVQFLLTQKVDLNAADARGNGALHCAVRNSNSSMLKMLLAAGALTKLKNSEGETALHLATALGNEVAVRQLLKAGSSMSTKNNSGWSASMLAERTGKSKLLSLFGRRSAPSVGRKGTVSPVSSESLLHLVRQGKLPEVKRLLNAGVPVDSKNTGGDTALTLAVSRGYIDLAVTLLGYGADVNLTDGRGATPLHLAVRKADEPVIRLLLRANADTELQNAAQDTPLQVAVKRLCGGCVTLLIAAEADLEAVDKNGMAPLLRAAQTGQKAQLEALLSVGANPFALDNTGRTSLWWAVKNQHSDVAYALLEHFDNGEIPKQEDIDGVTPLHLAVQEDDLELVRRLSVLNALNAPTVTGSSPLLLAAFAGTTSVVELLLALGAELDQTNSLGDTPLMTAIQQRHHRTALLLVKAGASLNYHNISGLSAKEMINAIDEPKWNAVLEEEQSVLAAIFKSLSE